MTFAATRHAPWALNTPKNAFTAVFRAHGTCLVAANVVRPRWGEL